MSDFRCRSCGLDVNICLCNNYKTIHENNARLFPKIETRTSIIAEFKNRILQLEKYYPEPDNEWATMVKDKDGGYVKLEDILNLF